MDSECDRNPLPTSLESARGAKGVLQHRITPTPKPKRRLSALLPNHHLPHLRIIPRTELIIIDAVCHKFPVVVAAVPMCGARPICVKSRCLPI